MHLQPLYGCSHPEALVSLWIWIGVKGLLSGGTFFCFLGLGRINKETERIANDVIDNCQTCRFAIFGEVWRGWFFPLEYIG